MIFTNQSTPYIFLATLFLNLFFFVKKLIRAYEDVKKRTRILNHHMGPMLVGNAVTFVTYYATIPFRFVFERKLSENVATVLYMVATCIAWISTGSFHQEVTKYFKKYCKKYNTGMYL